MPDKKVLTNLIIQVLIAFSAGYLSGSYLPLSRVLELTSGGAFNIKEDDDGISSEKELAGDIDKQKIKGKPDTCDFNVEVSGAVHYPGVYCLSQSSLVADALKKAGGVNKLGAGRYIAQKINLAQRVQDNEKIYFPFEDDIKCEMVKFAVENTLDRYLGDPEDKSADCVNLNFSTEKELDSLPGVGSVTAVKIIESRPFKNIDDLKSRKVVSDKVYTQIEKLLCL